jgi:hypothetical protein
VSVSPEELAAFADGQLDDPRRGEVATAVSANPALAAEVARHRAVRQRLTTHFAPILDEPVPESLTALLGGGELKVADFIGAKQHRATRAIPRWGWIVAPALAASLVRAVFIQRGSAVPAGYAGPQLASALDSQLVATQASDAPTRILLSFRDQGGQYCRAFSGDAQSGIACKDATGWQLRATSSGASAESGAYKMAGSPAAAILARAQVMAAGPALTAEQEQAARTKSWR